jgi:uncharacterized protein YndB with AHSA1/START domain
MIDLEFGVLIDCPVPKVYAFMTNPVANLPKWQTGVRSISPVTPGPIGPGSQFNVANEMLGRQIEGKLEILEMVPDQKLVFKMTSGPMEVQISASFKTVGTGTKLSLHAQGNPAGLFKVAEGALAGQVKSQMEANLARLKSVLEAAA